MANLQKIVLATNNKGKILEFSRLLQPLQIEVVQQSALGIPDAEETGMTFIENAILKARHASKISGLPALADDSGLAVAALHGAPGIRSARYAGDHADPKDHIAKLLAAMHDVPDDKRHAEFHCALVLMHASDDPTPVVCDGRWPGVILREARGANGFGYDPVFYVPSQQKSAAELTPEIKNKISHRALAIQALIKRLSESS